MDFTKIVELLDNEKRKELFSQALLLLGPTERSPVTTVASKHSAAPAVVNELESPGDLEDEHVVGENNKFSADQLLEPVVRAGKETPAQKYFKVGVPHDFTVQVFLWRII